jgi:tetratricopeptide (TPR) repeat protein
MWKRTALLSGLALLTITCGSVTVGSGIGGSGWWPGALAAGPDPAGQALPLPPVPPRIAEGQDYDHCLGMLAPDPSGARDFADAWVATGGGDGALHCLGLANVALGNPAAGADEMDQLAATSTASLAARASIYGQAGQAWMMAGSPDRALASTTLALSLLPDDPDLLIDRSLAEANLERFQDVVDDLGHALAIDPRRVDALVFRAAALRHLDQLDAARDDIDRAFALDPEYPDLLLERGILRQRRGDRSGARRDWEQTIKLSPNSASADLAQQNLALLDAGPERR